MNLSKTGVVKKFPFSSYFFWLSRLKLFKNIWNIVWDWSVFSSSKVTKIKTTHHCKPIKLKNILSIVSKKSETSYVLDISLCKDRIIIVNCSYALINRRWLTAYDCFYCFSLGLTCLHAVSNDVLWINYATNIIYMMRLWYRYVTYTNYFNILLYNQYNLFNCTIFIVLILRLWNVLFFIRTWIRAYGFKIHETRTIVKC